jgi:hypothetical protein
VALIKIDKFKGQVPIIADQLLPVGFAKTAKNCNLRSGNIVPYKDTVQVTRAVANGGQLKNADLLSIYKYGAYWFSWSTTVNVVGSPITTDTLNRVMWTGDTIPRMTVSTIATTGAPYPSNYYTLGIPKPTSAPTLSVNGGATTNVKVRGYVYTFQSAYGEEGPPSDPTLCSVGDETTSVDISTMDTSVTGNYNITHKNIYRILSGTADAEYQFVAQIALGTATYNDTKLDTALGEIMAPTASWVAPPNSMKGLTAMSNGIVAGFDGKRVLMCEPWQPHAWPYDFAVHHNVVGLGSYGNTLLVTTEGTPYTLTGDHPSAMTMERLEINQACVSKRGVVDLGYAVCYPSPDGLMMFGVGVAKNATLEIFTREQWQALKPDSFMAVAHDTKYFCFYDTGSVQGGFIYDPKLEHIVFIDLYAVAAFSDPLTDKLYLAIDDGSYSQIVQWDADVDPLTVTWKSGTITENYPLNFSAAQVYAASYPVTFKLYADGALKHTETVANASPFRLPSGYMGLEHEVELSGTKEIKSVYLARNMKELKVI